MQGVTVVKRLKEKIMLIPMGRGIGMECLDREGLVRVSFNKS